MTTEQIRKLYTIIANNYQTHLSRLDSKAYYENLAMFIQEYDYYLVANNLKNHITTSPYLPTIADLVKQPVKEQRTGQYVPNALETREMLLKLEQPVATVKDEEEIERIKQKIKTILKGAKEKYGNESTYNPFD